MAWRPEAPDGARQACVLVLDADPALFGLLDEWLGQAGFRVAAANDRETPEAPDLVIADLRAPRSDGSRTLREVRLRYPGVPVLALSAHFFAEITSRGAVARALGVDAALPKPVSQEALVATVRRLADA